MSATFTLRTARVWSSLADTSTLGLGVRSAMLVLRSTSPHANFSSTRGSGTDRSPAVCRRCPL